MSDTVIEVDDIWKKYRLGVIGTGTLRNDFERWWHRVRGKEDPHSKIGDFAKAESKKQKVESAFSNGAAGTSTGDNADFQISEFQDVSFSSSDDEELADDEVWALRGVSFEVKQGEILGIIGRNGAGKSTLLKILSRVTSPTRGEVRVKGRIASLLEVGTGFHPELTGRENIFLNGAILGMTKAEIRSKLDEIIAFAGIETYIDTPVKRYSSGMYVRLAFAVAVHLDSDILIIDEVLAVGDAEFQRKCLKKMQNVSTQEGRTILLVSHFMETITRLCRKAIFLDQGKAEISEDVSNATSRYLRRNAGASTAEWEGDDIQFDNPYFKPLRFWISRGDGQVEDSFSWQEDIVFFVTGIVTRANEATHVGITIIDRFDVVAFWSFHNDAFDQAKCFKPGVVTLQLTLPRRLLNEGAYRAELMCGLTFVRWIFGGPGDYCPSVEFTIAGGFSASPYWVDKRPGMVAPLLDWRVAHKPAFVNKSNG